MSFNRAGALVLCVCTTLAAARCSAFSSPGSSDTTRGMYDKTTGRLIQLSSDRNQNGTIDTWTDMDGQRPLRSRIDLDEDGTIDRWESYDDAGRLVKVGFSRKKDSKPDAWAFSRPDGSLERVDVSSTSDERKIDRREYYEAGVMVRVEEDSNGDGRADVWEVYERGALKSAEFDENRDGSPDRRLTYAAGGLATIESQRDAAGRYMKTEIIQQ